MAQFSVIIPTHNRLTLLRHTLESVLTQQFLDYEVIVVDDGSTDGTVEYLCSLGDRIQVIAQTNRGAGSARNAGAAEAKGTYLAFLDSDDLWFPWTLKVYSEISERYHSPAFIAGKTSPFSWMHEIENVEESTCIVEEFKNYFESSAIFSWYSASAFVIRKDAFMAVKGFSEKWGAEDAHLAMKLGCSPGFIHIVRPVTFGYRRQEASLSTAPTYLLSGAEVLIASERSREFPGGTTYERDRWIILTRTLRPITLSCLREGRQLKAWHLYQAMFPWHVALRRWKYLLAFPIFLVSSIMQWPFRKPMPRPRRS
jgi:cellulose synthase/poly-beta-1,6-N-acetylglucosamine synthase-like glycosyltransferase